MKYNIVFANIVWDDYGKSWPREVRFDDLAASSAQVAVKKAMNKIGRVYPDHGVVSCTVLVEYSNCIFLLHRTDVEPEGVLVDLKTLTLSKNLA